MKYITLKCPNCKKKYKTKKGLHNYRKNQGQINFYCSLKCTYEARRKKSIANKYINIKCHNCGKEFKKLTNKYKTFLKKGKTKFYCNKNCANKMQTKEALERYVPIRCEECGKIKKINSKFIRANEKRGVKTRFCSLKCRIKNSKKNSIINLICANCGKEFKLAKHTYKQRIRANKSGLYFCSKECSAKGLADYRKNKLKFSLGSICRNCGAVIRLPRTFEDDPRVKMNTLWCGECSI